MEPCAYAVLYVLEAFHVHSRIVIHNLAFLCPYKRLSECHMHHTVIYKFKKIYVAINLVMSYAPQRYTQA